MGFRKCVCVCVCDVSKALLSSDFTFVLVLKRIMNLVNFLSEDMICVFIASFMYVSEEQEVQKVSPLLFLCTCF